MSSSAKSLTPQHVITRLTSLLARPSLVPQHAPPCEWCHGPTVWTTGNKTRCTRCGYVPS